MIILWKLLRVIILAVVVMSHDVDNNIYRNQSTKSKQSVLGTRANYRRFVSNVDNDYEY